MDHAKWYIHINPTCKIKVNDNIKLLNNQYCRADHPYNIYYTQYILYNKNINILHLILFHDVNINKVLIFLLYIYYTFDENNINYCNSIYLIRIIIYYCSNVINTFNFNKPYIFDYSFNYEQLFLEDIIPSISNNDIIQIIKNNKILTDEILELKDNTNKLNNNIIELENNKINEYTENNNKSLLEELNNYKDQNKLLQKIIIKLENYGSERSLYRDRVRNNLLNIYLLIHSYVFQLIFPYFYLLLIIYY
jgi:hypothetical protein